LSPARWIRDRTTPNGFNTEAFELKERRQALPSLENYAYAWWKRRYSVSIVASLFKREGEPIDVVVVIEVLHLYVVASVETEVNNIRKLERV
jgi:hypothetical protein